MLHWGHNVGLHWECPGNLSLSLFLPSCSGTAGRSCPDDNQLKLRFARQGVYKGGKTLSEGEVRLLVLRGESSNMDFKEVSWVS